MTPEQHNKFVGISHLVHAGLSLLMTVGMMVLLSAMMALDTQGGPPAGFLAFMWFIVVVMAVVFYTPSIVAGYAFLKRRKWAKVAGIIAAVMSSMSAPIGTAVCAYTFWFLFSEPGKTLYDKPQQALPPMPPSWHQQSTQSREREPVFTQSSTPPDWR